MIENESLRRQLEEWISRLSQLEIKHRRGEKLIHNRVDLFLWFSAFFSLVFNRVLLWSRQGGCWRIFIRDELHLDGWSSYGYFRNHLRRKCDNEEMKIECETWLKIRWDILKNQNIFIPMPNESEKSGER